MTFQHGTTDQEKLCGEPNAKHTFKWYDSRYKELMGTALNSFDSDQRIAATKMTKWPYPVLQYTQREVANAVYFHPTADAWQRRRVSLKGLSTSQKLWWLKFNIEAVRRNLDMLGIEFVNLESIRTDNYIGALVRGGLLDTYYNIRNVGG